jgi:hypothetical protein
MRPLALATVCVLALASDRADAAIRYSVKRPVVDMTLSYELETEERTGSSSTRTDTTTTRQIFDIRTTRGWLYHPALLTFSAGLRPEFTQRSQEGSGTSDWTGTFLGLDLDATLFPYKPQYSVQFHARRDRSDRTGSFIQDATREFSVYRAELLLKNRTLPTTLRLESQEDTFETANWTRGGTTDRIGVKSHHTTPASRTELEAEVQEHTATTHRATQSTSLTTDRVFLHLNNWYRPGDRSRLNSRFRFTDQASDAFEATMTSLNSHLRVDHREDLDTHYQVAFNNRSGRDFESTDGSLATGLRHQLYENLTTRLDARAAMSESTGADRNAYAATADLRYIRRIPWGELNINLARTEEREDFRRLLTMEIVRDEPHAFTAEEALRPLGQFDIDADTVVVWEEREPGVRGARFELGDYQVVEIGDQVYIEWIDFGVATDDVVRVLVDYEYETDPSSETATSTTDFDINVDLWSTLRLYYRWNDRNVDLLSGTAPPDLRDQTSQGVGAALRWNRSWRGLKSGTLVSIDVGEIAFADHGAGTERIDTMGVRFRQTFAVGNWSNTLFEWTDQTLDGDHASLRLTPNRTLRARQSFNFRPTRRMTLKLNANYNSLERKDTGNRTEFTGVNGNMTWRLNGMGRLTARLFHERSRGLSEDWERAGAQALHEWRLGSWRPSASLELVDEERQPKDGRAATKRTNGILYFQVQRSFR